MEEYDRPEQRYFSGSPSMTQHPHVLVLCVLFHFGRLQVLNLPHLKIIYVVGDTLCSNIVLIVINAEEQKVSRQKKNEMQVRIRARDDFKISCCE